MQDYSQNVFSRGFILTGLKNKQVEEGLSNTSYHSNSFEKSYFGKYSFWYHKELGFSRVSNSRFSLCILGLCVDPYNVLFEMDSIAENLFSALTKGREILNEEIAKLTGDFCILYRDGNSYYLQQDAAATKSVYWSFDTNENIVVSSHSRVVATLCEKPDNEAAISLRQEKLYRDMPSPFLPGLMTAFEEVFPLFANHELLVHEGRQRRFYPLKRQIQNTYNVALDKLVEIFAIQAELIEKLSRPLILAATGGKDSRVSIASFSNSNYTSLYSFHYESNQHLSDDVKVAKTISSVLGQELKVYNLENYNDQTFKKYFLENSPLGIWPAASQCYVDNFTSNAIHIRSTVSEIGRCFYSKPANSVTPAGLAGTYSGNSLGLRKEILEVFQNYIEETEFDKRVFFGNDINDMFYWEHRNSKWQNILCQEAEMATDVFIPFNNRKLLELLLSVKPQLRREARLHKDVVRALSPALSDIEYC